MSTIQQFTNLVNSTPRIYQSDATKAINDVIRRSPLLAAGIAGRPQDKVLQSGTAISDQIFLGGNEGFDEYFPGEAIDIDNEQTHDTWEIPWAYNYDKIVWTEPELMQNNMGEMTASNRARAMKKVWDQKQQAAYTRVVNGLDQRLIAPPRLKMQSPTSGERRQAQSIPAMINENANGLHTVGAAGTWTTKQNINPTTAGNENWDNERLTYDYASVTDNDDGLLASLSKMQRRLHYHGLAKMAAETQATATDFSRFMILTSDLGGDKIDEALRAGGDRFTTLSRADGSFGTSFTLGGIPVWIHSELGSQALYANSGGTALVSEVDGAAARTGPRFYFLDGQHWNICFHTGKFMEKRPAREASGTIEYWYAPIVCWWNVVFSSLRRHGIVYPAA